MNEMRNAARIIALHGGLDALRRRPIRIDPPSDGLMRLCIELVGTGPNGLPLVSVAHYYELNGDLVADPEMTFEVMPDDGPMGWRSGTWHPVTFDMPGLGVYRPAVFIRDDRVMVNPRELADQRSFARTWDRNLGTQGFVAAFRRRGTKAGQVD
jgi:hypothetical protein